VDPSEDVEYVDHTLNHVFQGTSVSHLVQEMWCGSCGPLGIMEGLSFLNKNHDLNLVQFKVKLLKLIKALHRCMQYVSAYYPPQDYLLMCNHYRPDHEKNPSPVCGHSLEHWSCLSLMHGCTPLPVHPSPECQTCPPPSKAASHQAASVHFSHGG
jgi:hypothetical protein